MYTAPRWWAMCMVTRDPDCKSHPIPISWEGGHTPVCMQVAMPLSPGNPGGRGRVLCTRQAVPLLVGSPGGSNKEAVFKGHFRDTSWDPERESTPSRDPEKDASSSRDPDKRTTWSHTLGWTWWSYLGSQGESHFPPPPRRLGACGTVALYCTCTSCTGTTAIK